MGKLVKLSLEGSLDFGYHVELVEIKEDGVDGNTLAEGVLGKLPPAEKLFEDYTNWQEKYDHLDFAFRALKKRGTAKLATEISVEDCKIAADKFKESFNEWLESRSFLRIDQTLRRELNTWDDIRFIIKTNDYNLWKFPWSVWLFFQDYQNAEVAFSSSGFKTFEKPVKTTPRKQVKILAVCGDSTGIDYKPDQSHLNQLRSVGAELEFLNEPNPKEVRDRLWSKTWDILFFAGHSDSEDDMKTGHLYLNKSDTLSAESLENSLKNAIENGLKIAIFNSCKGLGIARKLVTDFKIPVVIAMREPVPNKFAQEFLEYFLLEYAYRKQPLYVAVRNAKERIIDEWRDVLPSIDWLPVICQNTGKCPPVWSDLHSPISAKQAVFTGVVCSSLVMLVRFFGLLQPAEFSAYDSFMQMKPVEKPDERILIVTIDEKDLDYQDEDLQMKNRRGSLSDVALAKLIDKLEPLKPQTIGLDIYHPQNFEPSLATRLQKDDRFFGICKLPSFNENENYNEVQPSKDLSDEKWGFSDIISSTEYNNVVRRHLLTMGFPKESKPACKSRYAFNFMMALHYLQTSKGIEINPDNGVFSLKNIVLKKLKPQSGGYQQVDTKGYQILLNYRYSLSPDNQNSPNNKPSIENIARTVSLRDVLNSGNIEEVVKDIKNPIVLIGTSGSTNRDSVTIPSQKEIPGVFLQAQKISQILSAVLDNRPLIWWWPIWGDGLWIFGWSMVGGFIILKIRHPLVLVLTGSAAIGGLFGICFIIFITQAGWVPVIPPTLALIGTQIVLLSWPNLSYQSQNNPKLKELKSWLK